MSKVAELDYEAFSPYGTAENLETYSLLFKAFRPGFVVLIVRETTHAQGLYLKRDFKIIQSRTEREVTVDVIALELKYDD